MPLTSGLEHYLRAVFELETGDGPPRPRDLAAGLGVSRPAVTAMVRSMVRKGLVRHEPYGVITLTTEGFRAASASVYRCRVLTDFFTHVLGFSRDQAEAYAGKMAHLLDREAAERLAGLTGFLRHCPPARSRPWQSRTRACPEDGDAARCAACLRAALQSLTDQGRPE
jgi:DtxR family Mn-dependent transcriptional regulator